MSRVASFCAGPPVPATARMHKQLPPLIRLVQPNRIFGRAPLSACPSAACPGMAPSPRRSSRGCAKPTKSCPSARPSAPSRLNARSPAAPGWGPPASASALPPCCPLHSQTPQQIN
eukprot:711705-Prorocentrum_minimum.AAC.4